MRNFKFFNSGTFVFLFTLYLLGGTSFAQTKSEVVLNWGDSNRSTVKVKVLREEEWFEQCVRGGLELKYRFELKSCAKSFWGDSCGNQRVETHAIQYDPIADSFKHAIDKLGDNDGPVVGVINTFEEALEEASSLEHIPVEYLSAGLYDKPTYISVRVFTDCKGEYSKIISKISYLLTLGLVRLGGFNTGWVDFKVEE